MHTQCYIHTHKYNTPMLPQACIHTRMHTHRARTGQRAVWKKAAKFVAKISLLSGERRRVPGKVAQASIQPPYITLLAYTPQIHICTAYGRHLVIESSSRKSKWLPYKPCIRGYYSKYTKCTCSIGLWSAPYIYDILIPYAVLCVTIVHLCGGCFW